MVRAERAALCPAVPRPCSRHRVALHALLSVRRGIQGPAPAPPRVRPRRLEAQRAHGRGGVRNAGEARDAVPFNRPGQRAVGDGHAGCLVNIVAPVVGLVIASHSDRGTAGGAREMLPVLQLRGSCRSCPPLALALHGAQGECSQRWRSQETVAPHVHGLPPVATCTSLGCQTSCAGTCAPVVSQRYQLHLREIDEVCEGTLSTQAAPSISLSRTLQPRRPLPLPRAGAGHGHCNDARTSCR